MSITAVGIDVGKAKLYACLMSGRQYQAASVFENTEEGHQQLAQWLIEQAAQSAHVCLEATGQYGYRVACHLHHLGYRVSIVNPTRIKGFAASLMQRSKSDRIDAKVIAQFCVALEPEQWQPPLEEQQNLQELMRRLSAVESILHQEKNREDWANHPQVKQSVSTHISQLEAEIERLNEAIEAYFFHVDAGFRRIVATRGCNVLHK